MLEILIDLLPWVLSFLTILMTIMAGSKHRFSWMLGAWNQVLWFVWIFLSGTWGLLPMNIAMAIVYLRNHYKWKREVSLDKIPSNLLKFPSSRKANRPCKL